MMARFRGVISMLRSCSCFRTGGAGAVCTGYGSTRILLVGRAMVVAALMRLFPLLIPFPLLGWEKTSISNNKQYRYFLNADDVEEWGSTIHDFSAKHIIPLMELKIGVLNQQISARRRGFRNQIRNLWWRKGKDDAPEQIGHLVDGALNVVVFGTPAFCGDAEQASYCFLLSTPTMSRKYGFHLVLSGDLYTGNVIRGPGLRSSNQGDTRVVSEGIFPNYSANADNNHLEELCHLLTLNLGIDDGQPFGSAANRNITAFGFLLCRTEDFIIDTLRLRVQIGPHLREVFKDPTKRKVLHGADRDIVWLQRDFGIYVCNMFDTGQSVSFCDSYPYVRYLCVCTSLEGIENGKAQPRIPVESFLWSRGKQRGQGEGRSCVHWLWLKLVIPWLGELWWCALMRLFPLLIPFLCLVGRASGILAEMRSTFGANDCRLLCINSSSDGAEEHRENLWASYKTSISNNKQYRYFLNADDVEEVGSRIHDFSAKHIIPLMELKIGVLNQQISARRRGFRNQIRNLWWRKGKDDAPEVDLEHNQYRSFQGLTCLMQISTRTEDFIIDTPRLRVQIGPHLREVLHGADRDIVWLQRDFGIYVCNMFDTGQSVSFCDSYPYVRYLCVCTSLEGIENGKAQHRIPVESFLWSRGKQRGVDLNAEELQLFQASGILAEMRSTFGANDCRLLCINSSSDGAEEHRENLWASYKTSISNNKQYGYFLNADDVEEISARRRGFRSQIRNLWWRKGKDDAPEVKNVSGLGMFDEAVKRVLEVLACGHQTRATQELFLREFFRIIQNALISFAANADNNHLEELCHLLTLNLGIDDGQPFGSAANRNITAFGFLLCRTEDFIIDTPRLRVQIGPHLREVFKDPTKRKVLHGADRDIVWLQRDFGIYVCNMFDTGQPMTEVWLKALGLPFRGLT
ncbi:UNVERIFIED_CONTAM: protein RRP6-like 2 [Sesamum calycinum]|uniref:Protein RRP6-like 2 n=1 Tax=Sesamum calycinum TaxID=2727403 RepID=A0AAW2J4J5_9LAMI